MPPDQNSKRKPPAIARCGGSSGVQINRGRGLGGACGDPSAAPVQNPGAKLARSRKAVAIIVGLAERFPHCFSAYDPRRRPLKVGIRSDVLAAAPAFDPDELGAALRRYTGSTSYLAAMRAGASRVDLDGNASGTVTMEEAAFAQRRARKSAARSDARRREAKAKLAIEPAAAKLKRLTIDDLRAAARLRKQREASI
jgi:sRNA-binding protein